MKTCIASLVVLIFVTGCAGGIQRYAHPQKKGDIRPVWLGVPASVEPEVNHTGGLTVVSTPWSYYLHREPQDVVGTLTIPIGPVQVSEGYRITTPEVEVQAEWPWWFNASFPTYPVPGGPQPSVVRGP